MKDMFQEILTISRDGLLISNSYDNWTKQNNNYDPRSDEYLGMNLKTSYLPIEVLAYLILHLIYHITHI